jgi:hypothetical protein
VSDTQNGTGLEEEVASSKITRLPGGDSRGSRIANRVVWIQLPEPYDNLEFQAWLDYPREVAMLWTPVENETARERGARTILAARETFLHHRGISDQEPWQDEDGELPSPTTQEFWNRIPTALGGAMLTAFFEEMAGNRASRRSQKRNRVKYGRSSS